MLVVVYLKPGWETSWQSDLGDNFLQITNERSDLGALLQNRVDILHVHVFAPVGLTNKAYMECRGLGYKYIFDAENTMHNTLEKWIGHWGFILGRFQYFSAWKLLTWTWLRDASLVVATAALAATLARAASPFSRPRFTSRKTAGPSSWHAQLVPLVLIKPLKLGKNMKEYLPSPVFVPPIAQWCHALPCDIQFLKLWYSTRLHHHICSAWWARVTSTSRN